MFDPKLSIYNFLTRIDDCGRLSGIRFLLVLIIGSDFWLVFLL